jgi:hypothetical protein
MTGSQSGRWGSRSLRPRGRSLAGTKRRRMKQKEMIRK